MLSKNLLGVFTTALLFSFALIISPTTLASGACSSHVGVDCSAGPDKDGSVICLDGWKNSSVLYSKIEDVCGGGTFRDVPAEYPYSDAIQYLYDKKIINGYSDGTFKPKNTINRAEFLKILVEASGVSPDSSLYQGCFSDVTSEWYAKYICYAKEIGWINGYPDGTYRPNATVSKVETLKMILNSQGVQITSTGSTLPFSDITYGAWYLPYVSQALDMTILQDQSLLYPSRNMTREEVAELLYKTLTLPSSY